MALPSISNYASLVANLSDYLARNDLEDYYPTFIALAETRLNSKLKTPGMEVVSTVTLGADLSGPVPADYVEWIGARWIATGANGPSQRIRFVEANSPEFTHRHRPNGNPQFYTVVAGAFRLAPARAGTLEVFYYRRIPPLTAESPTNWLITKAPQLYLYAVMAEAYYFQKDEAMAAEWMKGAEDRLAAFVMESSSAKVGRRAERAAEDAAEAVAAKALN